MVRYHRINLLATLLSCIYAIDYEFDARTTYCYFLDQGLQVENADSAYIHDVGKNEECPVTIALSQAMEGPVPKMELVPYEFTVKRNRKNKFNLDELYTARDPFTGRPAEIVHANIHSCSHTTICDIFRSGADKKVATQETSNFTNDESTFHQSISFDHGGEYTVFAHVILAGQNIRMQRYDIMVFTTTTVLQSKPPDSSLSTGALVGIAIGGFAGLVALFVGIGYFRRRRNQKTREDQFLNGPMSTSIQQGKHSVTASSHTKLGISVAENQDYPWAGSNFKTSADNKDVLNVSQLSNHSAPDALGRRPYQMLSDKNDKYHKPFGASTGTLNLESRSSAQTSTYNPFEDSSTCDFERTHSFGNFDASNQIAGEVPFGMHAPAPDFFFPSYPGRNQGPNIVNREEGGPHTMETLQEDSDSRLNLSISVLGRNANLSPHAQHSTLASTNSEASDQVNLGSIPTVHKRDPKESTLSNKSLGLSGAESEPGSIYEF
ncbi:Ag1508 [Albugo candida]|uniref:Ag1508 protein n=1 Tax=Albugo candida TaxID=65357 RepID=A0A024G6S3_9STRA|nr:Ag1508 [Albugo candida]|eukprot:CCI42264.1 Ag1508 [Albugo candida]